MQLVNFFKAAAQGYGTERRVLLLHGPVGTSKTTIARLLKKGLEEYSRTPEGALYTFGWMPTTASEPRPSGRTARCTRSRCTSSRPSSRGRSSSELNEELPDEQLRVRIDGDLCPFCRQDVPRAV